MYSFDLRDDFGFRYGCITSVPAPSTILFAWVLAVEAPAMPEGGGTLGGSSPKIRFVSVKTESTIESYVRMIHALGRVFLDSLRKRIQQAPTGRFRELLMLRMFELTKHGENIARIDRP